jgi:hypothetical protein
MCDNTGRRSSLLTRNVLRSVVNHRRSVIAHLNRERSRSRVAVLVTSGAHHSVGAHSKDRAGSFDTLHHNSHILNVSGGRQSVVHRCTVRAGSLHTSNVLRSVVDHRRSVVTHINCERHIQSSVATGIRSRAHHNVGATSQPRSGQPRPLHPVHYR